MSKKAKKILQGEYDRLKKVLEKIMKPKNERELSSLILQPVRNPSSLKIPSGK